MSQFYVNWELHLNQISKGFSVFQQNEEFVDMTLAAEGHLVKVHQNVIAIASPYLKAMLKSASCRHPVIFLNNISHEILEYILQYIYTGEVKVPSDVMQTFLEACKSLCIRGVDSIIPPKDKLDILSTERVDKPPDNNFAAHITINSKDNNNYNLQFAQNNSNTNIDIEEVLSSTGHEASDISTLNKEMDYEITGIKNKTSKENDIDDNIPNVIILSQIDITSNCKNLTTNSSNIDNQADNSNRQECTINNTVNLSDCWISKSNQNILNKESMASTSSHIINIHTQDPQITSQLNSNSHLSTDQTENIICLPIDWPEQSVENNLEPNVNITENSFVFLETTGELTKACETAEPITTKNDTYIKEEAEFDVDMDVTSDGLSKSQQSLEIKVNKEKIHTNLKKIGSYVKSTRDNKQHPKVILNKVARINIDDPNVLHFTISNRGSLQIIFNTYIFNCHHYSNCGRKRRWRCIEYRKRHCMAFIDTDYENMTAVSADHTHPNHNSHIRKKLRENIVFASFWNAVETINTLLRET